MNKLGSCDVVVFLIKTNKINLKDILTIVPEDAVQL